MAHFNFVIPSRREELLTENQDYFVRNTIGPKELVTKQKEARQILRDEGAVFILEYFDVFYSVLHHHTSFSMDVVFRSYQDLHKATTMLQNSLPLLLEDRSGLDEELKQKYQNVLKMLIYIYVNTILLIEQKNITTAKNKGLLKERRKSLKNDMGFSLDKKSILLTLNNIIQSDIAVFWDPPVVEENFINIIAEVCYKFLENPLIKGDKDTKEQLFNLIGTLIKTYNHSTTFAIRMAQMIKDEEHLVQCLSDGVKQLVDVFHCKGLIHALVREITEWQTDEKFQDSQGSRFCAQLLTAMAVSMPTLMLPEVLYLNQYLYHESATLRNSVLNVITEVIIQVLTKHTLNQKDAEYRDEFLSILLEHMRDNSAHVRTRVFQHWARLQEENAIPRHMVNSVLQNVRDYHLHDKSTLVRKSATNCVTTFLTHNPYGSKLSLTKMKMELESSRSLLDTLKPQIEQAKVLKSAEMEVGWEKLLPELKEILLEELQKEDDSDNENENQMGKTEATEIIRTYLSEGKYRDAFQVWKASADEFDDIDEDADKEDIMNQFLCPLKVIYMKGLEVLEGIENGFSHGDFVMTEDDFRKFMLSKEKVEYLTEATEFLTLVDGAIELIVELLETTFISDMQEAVAFFISAYQFDIDNSNVGIMAMLRMMQRNEQDRKDMVIEAFKTIYLKTSSSNMEEHCTTIVNRLIGLLKSVPAANMDDLELIISEWVGKGILDNSVIDMLWQYFTKKVSVTDEDCQASVELLRMAAISRRTIILRNIKLVASIGFGEMGQNNMAFLGSCCNLLSIAGRDRIDITSANPPFKIAVEDQIFKDLFKILTDNFFNPVEFYHHALSGALEFVYKVCGQPDVPCEQFVIDIIEQLPSDTSGETMIDRFVYIRVCQLLGLLAVKHLDYLDETVYKELKRREHVLSTKGKRKNRKRKSKHRGLSSSVISNNDSCSTTNSTTMGNSSLLSSIHDESNLEGAQAEDEDAEFILRVLERNTVTGQGLLAQLAPIVINVCEKPDVFDDVILQGAAVIALIRFMLVSSEFCKKHIQLVFTIFERTKHSDIKVSILVHLSDLLTRFPNIIEPWTSRIYERLKDPLPEIRKATFFTLSGLILRDMIRAHSHIHLMVNSLVDPDKELSSMCRTFFVTLGQKENNLYSALPDIFSHLMESQEVTEENIKDIMKFLFELMDKAKHMENLVDRFCSKFEGTEDIRHQRNIAYCLSLITYNERGLRKLQENFSKYKHLVHDPEIYASFKTIMQACNKQQAGKADLKPIVAEIEKCINSVFDVNSDAQLMRPPPPPKPKKKGKGPTRSTPTRKRKAKKKSDSDDSDSD